MRRAALLVLVAMIAISGCQRRSRFKPLPPDSTAVGTADSLAAATDAAVKRWEGGEDEDAARLSAAVVLGAIRPLAPETWSGRVRALLDSLSIGAEIDEAPAAMMVNFFARADPERGSWPYLFWSTDIGPRQQAVEGRDLRLMDLATRGGPGAPSAVAALFARRGATGGQPIAFAWKSAKGGAFTLTQTLGSDSLGGAGTGEFVRADTTIELHTRTYRATRGFTECATCPHVYTLRRFRWGRAGFVRESGHQVPSPYSTFVRFVQALQANDREAGFAELSDGSLWDQARQLDWHQRSGLWRAAPSTDEIAQEMVFFRGEQEAYRVSFESRFGGWKITGFEGTSRAVE
ncbi:MAG: hypothetical protein ABIS67_12210 [Candidatus Eisenbacteria bacterium]